MKYKTTSKAIKSNFRKIYAVGYGDLQYLFMYEKPNAYTSGVYGWNCDFYDLGNGICISTGYKPIGESLNHDIIRKYDETAREVIMHRTDYEQIKSLLAALILHLRTELENI